MYRVLHDQQANSLVFVWDKYVLVKDRAIKQAEEVARLPFVERVCLMPDAHWGKGAAIGSVIATKDAIIPAAVGVDIGCGLSAMLLQGLNSADLTGNRKKLRQALEERVPVGFKTHEDGEHFFNYYERSEKFDSLLEFVDRLPGFMGNRKKTLKEIVGQQFGTMGGGNHFLEVCVDDNDRIWLLVHSGSRGIGHMIGTYFANRAKELCEARYITLENPYLAYFTYVDQEFDAFIKLARWAQWYAEQNRFRMLDVGWTVAKKMFGSVGAPGVFTCHHNYIDRETHNGRTYWITRKGAVRARKGDDVIIPGNMGTKSYIAHGLGESKSLTSCAHGAGRAMSRTEARRQFTVDYHLQATDGVECRKDKGVLDETPGAYKDLDLVMASQADLVKKTLTLRQKICIKG